MLVASFSYNYGTRHHCKHETSILTHKQNKKIEATVKLTTVSFTSFEQFAVPRRLEIITRQPAIGFLLMLVFLELLTSEISLIVFSLQ
jgi:hypothetical protein